MCEVYKDGEVKVKKITRRYLDHIVCDKCKKEIPCCEYDDIKSEYFNVHTCHNSWGNDSIDSHKYFDLCKSCVKEFTLNYIDDGYPTREIEIIRRVAYSKYYDEQVEE